MADEEQLRILKQGVKRWNAWREQAGDIAVDLRWINADLEVEPTGTRYIRNEDLRGIELGGAKDLSGANLSQANLEAADLRGVCLSRANLRGADFLAADLRRGNLSEANLSEANLAGTFLNEANLSRADLSGADLSRAHLSGADFTKANLSRADLGTALSGANLSKTNLSGTKLGRANFSGANLSRANLSGAKDLSGANLRGVDLRRAKLREANLRGADLSGANLRGADFSGANLSEASLHVADLRGAKLIGADLSRGSLTEADLREADLTGSRVYGVAVWGLRLRASTKQQGLIITPDREPEITTDDIEIAQFLYLLIHNEKIRNVIDTIGKKAVLILGRFTPERKTVLDDLRDELRRLGYLPILFDFEKPASKDLTATVSTLANLVRFIIADLTDPSSIPYELATVVPTTPVAIQPILLSGMTEFSMFADLRRRYGWVLTTHHYDTPAQLIADLRDRVVQPAETKALELQRR
jgi:uncharacterized protein YjbI with pentapeptide repeats